MPERLEWAISICREKGLRKTRALEEVLRELILQDKPLRLEDLAKSKSLANQCDRATLYRLLIRLEENKIVKRLGLHERAAYYVMKYPDQHGDYLICRDCGSIEKLNHVCPVEQLEKQLAVETGYADLQHELEFFGTCPDCVKRHS
jgi:Fur family ferric uptake transcriptional regulator